MTGLSKSDFCDFYNEVHGYPPFKWQVELANQVFDHRWPRALKMPTASGKTSVIDIAVFHLALEADRSDRTAPLRIVFVVDRRLVVDDAFEHADALSGKIFERKGPITKKVYDALMNAFDRSLNTVKLRGGMPQESDWAETPDQPLVIISTVDQVGSRLLFRGYGVSDSMKPVHAGLLGSDVLYILDEADTSKPFLDTLNQISSMRRQGEWRERNSYPFSTVFMSATLQYDQDDIFPKKGQEGLLLEDEKIRKRISAHKHATLIPVDNHKMIDTVVELAISLSPLPEGKNMAQFNVSSIGIVVNTVKMAREIFSSIRERIKEYENASAHLLIGRARPFDRDGFVKSKINTIRPNSNDNENVTTFFVATQCVEVGVNIDFDALITQIAPLDSLQQRFGRLDRIGKHGQTQAYIVANRDDIKNKENFIYKDRLVNTWKWLNDIAKSSSNNSIDFGIKFFNKPDKEKLEIVTSPKPRSVTLMPSYVRAWSQTSPHPHPDPDPALFLHGHESKSADVQIVWRADITNKLLADSRHSPEQIHSVYISPPSALEAVSVPIWTVKKWLTDYDRDQPLSDIEGVMAVREEKGKMDSIVLRWRGAKNKHTKVIKSTEIVPGDTIVVPSTYGGCDKYGWDDSSVVPVEDIGMEVNLIHRRRLTMRFDKDVMTKIGDSSTWKAFEEVLVKHAGHNDAFGFLADMINIESFSERWKEILKVITEDSAVKNTVKIHQTAEGDSLRITGLVKNNLSEDQIRRILANLDLEGELRHKKIEKYVESTTDDDSSDVYGSEIELIDHCRGVQKFAEKFGNSIRMNSNVLNDVALASLLHDVGKAENRFQALLRRMDPDDLLQEKIIAKSITPTRDRGEYVYYRKIAHLPEGHRHECWSVLLAERYSGFNNAKDPDLVKYLIGTHHGRGRPMFPPVNDSYPTKQIEFKFNGEIIKGSIGQELSRLDSGWIDIHHRMYKKYGPWNLAHMESIIRLADHCQSRKEVRNA